MIDDGEQRNSDPLLPRYLRRLRSLSRTQAFPPFVLSVAVFLTALGIGGLPDINAGFVETSSLPGSPVPQRTTTTLAPTTTITEPDVDVIDASELRVTVVAAGFPEVVPTVEGGIVTLGGTVPDAASRDAVLRLAFASSGVSEVVDNLEIQPAAGAASLTATVGRTEVVFVGVVASRSVLAQAVGPFEAVYRPDQINTDGVTIDAEVAPLGTVLVVGSLSDPMLLARVDAQLSQTSSLRFQVDLERADSPRIEGLLDDLLLESPIEFDLASAALSDDASEVIDAVADVLSQFPDAGLEVGGHTDGQGSPQANLSLSQDRADAVVRALRARGVSNQLVAVGYGALRLKVDPESSAGDQATNRRIEFRLL